MNKVFMRTSNDCVRAAFASVLNLRYEDLPEIRSTHWQQDIDEFLHPLGYRTVNARLESPKAGEFFEGTYVGSIESNTTGQQHCVVCSEGKIIFDPQLRESNGVPSMQPPILEHTLLYLIEPDALSELKRLREENERLTVALKQERAWILEVAEALHPHKPKSGGWTFLPQQFGQMVAALREDRERLDWLSDNTSSISNHPHPWREDMRGDIYVSGESYRGTSLRTAIDAACAKERVSDEVLKLDSGGIFKDKGEEKEQ